MILSVGRFIALPPASQHDCATCSWMCSRDFSLLVAWIFLAAGVVHALGGGAYLASRRLAILSGALCILDSLPGLIDILCSLSAGVPIAGWAWVSVAFLLPGILFFHPAARWAREALPRGVATAGESQSAPETGPTRGA